MFAFILYFCLWISVVWYAVCRLLLMDVIAMSAGGWCSLFDFVFMCQLDMTGSYLNFIDGEDVKSFLSKRIKSFFERGIIKLVE